MHVALVAIISFDEVSWPLCSPVDMACPTCRGLQSFLHSVVTHGFTSCEGTPLPPAGLTFFSPHMQGGPRFTTGERKRWLNSLAMKK